MPVTVIPHLDLIRRASRRTMTTGPVVSAEYAAASVASLRELAQVATTEITSVSLLEAPATHETVIVDRAGWVTSNLNALAVISEIGREDAEVGEEDGQDGNPLADRAGAIQTGLALGWASGKVLGQYEALADPGRLLLVAPNIVQVAQTLDLDERDFQLWVCLHEETHRLQFGAVPWMQAHFIGLIKEMIGAEKLPGSSYPWRIIRVINSLIRADDSSVIELVQSDDQVRIYRKIVALLTLLEGHADFVMDQGGPDLVPSVAEIRKKFEVRRDSNKNLASRLLGMDEKLMQYRKGEAFVRSCVTEMGVEDFNVVWAAPENLPDMSEIENPAAWRTRILTHHV
ncbi:MAG: zinc-dependent metalloprotease [Candidatus Nanopelagicales bacterium]|nr:coenzyme F420 biosynthesis-associated protein [Actinomycetota bacterium]NCG03150.1 coenzyme F420 biosynthesis-associated protein [Actinomycetales bacterium]